LVTLYQKNAGFDAAKLHRNPVDNRVQEFIQFEDRANWCAAFWTESRTSTRRCWKIAEFGARTDGLVVLGTGTTSITP